MKFRQKLKKDDFLVTCEIGPPKGTHIKAILEEAGPIKGRADAINVTDLQSSVMRLGSLATCYLLKQRGHEPIFQLTCRDRNRLALQSDLLSAAVLEIENVLILTGDHPVCGDHPQAKPVYDLDSVQLLKVVDMLNSGKDMVGSKLQGATNFCKGAALNPGAEPIELEIIKMEKKIEAGAEFFQTQGVFDLDSFANFMKKISHIKVPVIASVILLKSEKMAQYMNENVAGIKVPKSLINEISDTKPENREEKSIEIAARLIKELKNLCRGVHIMPIGWNRLVPMVLDAAGL